MNISNSEENYLKTIFHLQADTEKVNTNAVAEKLNTRPASVTDMMKKLSAKKLLDYQPYKGFSLSGEGRKIALGIVRRHRLWEYFLVEKLHLGWDEVHEIAEELEHVSSKRLIDKLDEYLGFPKFDPHGDPIPDSKGKLRRSNEILLLQLPLHQRAEVCRVGNQSAEMLELLQHKNIRIGTKLEVKNNFHFDGSIEVKVKNTTVSISEQLAKNIFVTYES
ncbi:metal-dependent transcriptional regulator [Chitinophagaceae bacterium LB-8]|uniref:Transcriptional regulator MntR n=1 Tax=Paraflavisolibacter caeni TaxID=2982496 RepID=A0A9X3B8A0_9BACT|nr:metal-dependent transcriptional regulator [Paraflavisolibacter caeni]MCU7550385.1 metal-dependent transcriptional regulator [Paraflavisolibacter caeni]